MDEILDGLNDEQRAAVEHVRGPLSILAGAGTGKTTTITRRIAYQIASGTFRSDEILAVTFTERAANEMRERLAALGAGRVRARTFHAEALAQVAHVSDEPPRLLDSKAPLVGPLVRRLPAPFKFRATKDVAGEIERAKNRRVPPSRYEADLDGHTPPIPPDLMARVYGEYEARKRRAGRIDFEDLLELAIRMVSERPDVAERLRTRYRAFTVDEYQDVNLLQQTLLEAWLGPRDEVCVVGDDHQSIFGFTGATPAYLLAFAERFPGARCVTLERNYRSTAQVLGLANRLAPSLGGRTKTLRAVLPDGPEPQLREHATGAEETAAVVEAIRRLRSEGVPCEQIAILFRINARSEDFEEALSRAGVPFQVRDGSFLRRPGPRAVLHALGRGSPDAPAGPAVAAAAAEIGWAADGGAEEDTGIEEQTRQADLSRLVRLAEEFEGEVRGFVEDLRSRFSAEAAGRGVVLSTYHRAKGLEFDGVFLPRLEERELPFALSRSDAEVDEERRLLYVGLTRAKRWLTVSWARSRDGRSVRPSRFVAELVPDRPAAARTPARSKGANGAGVDTELFARLRTWRASVASDSGLPPYCVFHDATLRAICELRPVTMIELAQVSGVGPTKLARYGSDVLDLVRRSG